MRDPEPTNDDRALIAEVARASSGDVIPPGFPASVIRSLARMVDDLQLRLTAAEAYIDAQIEADR